MTLADLRERLAQRAKDAAAMSASAPVADVLGVILAELDAVEGNGAAVAGEEPADRLLDVEQAAALLDVRPRWMYDHAARLPFTRKLGGRTLRFSEAGLRRWLERRRAA
ncbi:MAG: helix-turn-helix domain-containing protein [Gemmatimonadales bacterium]